MIADFQPQLDAVGGGTAKPMPRFDNLLQQVGKRRIYVVYKTACQIVHPATRALSLVRDLKDAHSNEPPVATFGYRTTEQDWTTAVLLGAESLSFGLETLTRWLQAPQMSPRARGLFNSIVAQVKTFR